MSLIVAGTMAYDAIETPFGKVDKVVGGSAVYIAHAASYFIRPVRQVSIVGNDFGPSIIKDLNNRGIWTEGVEVVQDMPSFFWKGKYSRDMNSRETLATDLNVLANFKPIVPDSYQGAGFLMLGNLTPKIQIDIIQQLKKRPRLIAMDTMNLWMDTALADLKVLLTMVDVLILNDSEAGQLSGERSIVRAARTILGMGVKTLVIKKGEHGALLFQGNDMFHAAALPLEDVFDPTGAGDAFAGGFIGHLAKTKDLRFENMRTAIVMGSVMASFCVEKFGTQRLLEISVDEVYARLSRFSDLVNFNII